MRKIVAAAGVVLVSAIAFKVITTLDGPSDRQLIRDAVEKALKDSREGKPGSVVDLLANSITVNDSRYEGNSREIVKFIRESKPDVSLERIEPQIIGDEARIVTPATIKAQILTMKMERRVGEITLILTKETSREWGMIPKRSWKLSEVRVPETSVADLLSPGF